MTESKVSLPCDVSLDYESMEEHIFAEVTIAVKLTLSLRVGLNLKK